MLRSIPLSVQVDMIFRDLREELCRLTAGTVFIHIKNERVSNYGIRHRMENRMERKRDGTYPAACISCDQLRVFRELAVDLLLQKRDWNKGTVSYKFKIRNGYLHVLAHYEDRNDECVVE